MNLDLDTKIKKCLREVFKLKYFKSKEQLNAIRTVLTEESDVLINLPPAAGKSLCFQIPAVLCKNKVAIVVMENKNSLQEHVQFLKNKGIDVSYFHSQVSQLEQIDLFNELSTLQVIPKFIYLTIATCASKIYKELLHTLINNLYEKDLISMLIVDDAHCSSNKTIDYNINYTEILAIRNKFQNIRLIALTSIGTETINNDIKTSLGMFNTVENNGSYNWIRPNIYLEVKFKDLIKDPYGDVQELIQNFIDAMESFSGIIICRKCEETITIADQLTARGIPTVPYITRMKFEDQKKSLEKWMTGRVVMIATTHGSAIGLNKSNVGCIIHWSLPLTMEQYYRDIGKAGRLGGNALSRLYFGLEDWMNTQFTMMGMSEELFSGFQNVLSFCIADKCRHVSYSEIFGFQAEPCENVCDVCENGSNYRKNYDKFQIYERQHRLLANEPNVKIPKLYIYKTILNLKESLRTSDLKPENSREINFRRLAKFLIINYRRVMNVAEDSPELGIIMRLARSLEYIAFFTNNNDGYLKKIYLLVKSLKKDTRLRKLSNYIINYKCKHEDL